MKSLKVICIAIIAILFSSCNDNEDPAPLEQEQLFLLGEQTYPEGIAIHPNTGEVFIAGFGDGSIQKVSSDGVSSYVVEPEPNNSFQNVGIELDIVRDRIWTCQIDFSSGISRLRVYSLQGQLLKIIEMPDNQSPHFLNDVVVDEQGNAYITDSFAPQIWQVTSDLEQMSIWVSDNRFINSPDFFNLNGITFTPDNKYIIATSVDLNGEGDLFRIDLATKEVTAITVDDSELSSFFFGGDGIVFEDNSNLLLFSFVQGVVRASFTDNYTTCKVEKADKTSNIFDSFFNDFPTTGKIHDNNLYLVFGQLDHIVSGLDSTQFGTTPNPFYITKTPLSLIK